VLVTDGRLTLTNGPGAYRNKICFIEIDSTASRAYPFMSYAAWSSAHFSGWPGSPDSAPAADPDSDGVPNVLEYATGGLPGLASTGSPGHTTLDLGAPGLMEFSFLRSAQALDAGYSVWESEDLLHWSPLWSNREDADFSSPLVDPAADPGVDSSVTLHLPFDESRSRHFFRLQVDLP
jgi:hypothetical protein